MVREIIEEMQRDLKTYLKIWGRKHPREGREIPP